MCQHRQYYNIYDRVVSLQSHFEANNSEIRFVSECVFSRLLFTPKRLLLLCHLYCDPRELDNATVEHAAHCASHTAPINCLKSSSTSARAARQP